jgi:predicted DCC family thiol-disulfide oxidoreductase YuxK
MRVLVYDDMCSMCVAKSRSIVAWARVGEAGRRALSSYEGEAAERLEVAGARNELAVLDEATGAIESGYDGIVGWLAGTRGGFLVRCLGFAPVRLVGRVVYRVIAYNRRIVAPPRGSILCACDPDPKPFYNGLLSGLLWLAATPGLAELFLSSVSPGLRTATPTSTLILVAWCLLVPAAYVAGGAIARSARSTVANHLLWISAAGALPFVGALVARVIAGGLGAGGSVLFPASSSTWLRIADGVALALAAVLVFREVRRRLPHLRALRAADASID